MFDFVPDLSIVIITKLKHLKQQKLIFPFWESNDSIKACSALSVAKISG